MFKGVKFLYLSYTEKYIKVSPQGALAFSGEESDGLPSFFLEDRSTMFISPSFTEIFLHPPPSYFLFFPPETVWDSRTLFSIKKKKKKTIVFYLVTL